MRTNTRVFIMSHSLLPRMRNVSDKSFTGYKKHILCSVTFFLFQNRAVYEIE